MQSHNNGKMKQLNLMHTPYEILQLKQKQKRKIISEHKKQRTFNIRSNKNGLNATTYYMEKAKPPSQTRYQTVPVNLEQDKKCSNSQKKYEIIFRQSIRKVNTYRTKVYHTHNALKKQKFVNRFAETPRENQSPRYKDFIQNYSTANSNPESKAKAKTGTPQKECESLNVGKYRIYLMPSPQKPSHDQFIPGFSIEKCKLNLTDNQYKHKIQKTIQTLYQHNKKMEITMKNCTLDSFTQRDNFSQETQRKNSTLNCFDAPENVKTFLKSPRSTSDIKQQIKLLKKGETFINSFTQKLQPMDNTKVANFIRNKRKKRLPISTLRTQKMNDNDDFNFKRAITDNFCNNLKQQNLMKNPQKRYFSPNKGTRCGARIKFNSIEQNISGWQYHPLQNSPATPGVKSPLLEY